MPAMLGHMGTDYPFPLTVRKIHGTETDKQIPECCFMLFALNTASTIKLQGAHKTRHLSGQLLASLKSNPSAGPPLSVENTMMVLFSMLR